MTVLYLIPLISKQRASNWELTNRLLRLTLNSLLNQTDENWQAIVACHDKPEFPINDSRICCSRFEHDTAQIHPQNDKAMKLAGSLAQAEVNWHYCMGLDADDLVHRDLTGHLNGDRSTRAWRISLGYQLDFPSQRIFAHDALGDICGSTVILDRETVCIPADLSMAEIHECMWWKCGHQSFPNELANRGIAMSDIPFPSLIYTVNQGSDWQKMYNKNWLKEQAKRFVKFHLKGERIGPEIQQQFGLKS